MRWDSQLIAQASDESTLPFAGGTAVVRTFKTPEFAGMSFYEIRAKSIINHVPGDRFGFNWTINPYRGCSHSCEYCFARPTHTYLDFNAGDDFENKIVVKVNAVELLHKELRKRTWGGELIAMGTNTDPYQRAEGHYKLMRGILQELNAVRNPYSILTKGTLIQRDIDLLQEGAEVTNVSTNFSVGTIDEKVWRESEPGTPHPMKRLEVVRKLNESGISCGVLMAPILPGISDSMEKLEATVRAAAEAGATHITPIVLHLRPGVKEEFIPWLEAAYPGLVHSYETTYKRSNAPEAVREPIVSAVGNLKRRYKVNSEFTPARGQKKAPAPEREEQLSLDLDLNNGRKAPKWVKGNL